MRKMPGEGPHKAGKLAPMGRAQKPSREHAPGAGKPKADAANQLPPKRILVAGAPQSGKTRRLIGVYLDSLREQPFARRTFLAPDTSHRNHLRVQVMRQGGLDALPEGEIITFPEFLYNLGLRTGLVTGRRMTPLEERIVAMWFLQDLVYKDDKLKPVPATLASAGHFIAGLTALRRAGLYARDATGEDVPQDLGCELMEAYSLHIRQSYKMNQTYDGLLPQEVFIEMLHEGDDYINELLPELLLIDGFWDFIPLHKIALRELAQYSRINIYMSIPLAPGDRPLAKLESFATELGLEREELPPRNEALGRLLTALAAAREGKECAKELGGAIAAEGVELRPCTTHQSEADFIGDTVLKLHRREGVPLDEFLVILNSVDARFIAALERVFASRGLPLIDLTKRGKPALMGPFLAACFAYAAKQDALTLRALLLASCPYVLRWNHLLFAHIMRMGAFLDVQSLAPVLASPEQQSFTALLEELGGLRRVMGKNESILRAQGAAEEWGNLLLAKMRAACADDADIAREKAALDAAIDALDAPVGMVMPPDDLLAVAAEACSGVCAPIVERRTGGVYLVDALVARQWQKRVVFIPQCSADNWPRPFKEINVGGEKLRKALVQGGMELRAPEDTYAFEETLFLSALSRACDNAFVTYPQRQFDGKPLLPSPFLFPLEEALKKLGGAKPEHDAQVFADEQALALTAAKELRWGDCIDTGMESGVASAVFKKCDEALRDGMLRAGGIASEDAAAPVAAADIPQKFSPYALTAFRKCPYYYFASQLLDLGGEMATLEDGLSPDEVGKAVHAALKDAFERKLAPDALLGVFTRKIKDVARERGYLGKFELELQRELTIWRVALREFYETELWLMKKRKSQVAEMERDLKLEMQDANGAPFSLHGFIDRADRTRDGYAVYDYKSGRASTFGMGEGKEIVFGLSLAWLIYPLIVQEAFKAKYAPPFSLLFVRDNEGMAVACDGVIYELLTASMLQNVASIRTRLFPRAPHTAAVECSECEMYSICRRDVFTESAPNVVQESFADGKPCVIVKEERE